MVGPMCGAKHGRLALQAEVAAPLTGAVVAIFVVDFDAGVFLGHVKHIHDSCDDEVQIANVVQVAVALFGPRNGDVFV